MVKKVKQLNINDKIKFGKHQVNTENPEQIIWKIVAKGHISTPAYPQNSITLQTDRVIDMRALDSLESTNPDSYRKIRGSNRYSQSNLLQWLNSNALEGQWYSPQHIYDSPPDSVASVNNIKTFYAQRAGFLHFFTEKELNSIQTTTVRVAKNLSIDGGGYEDVSSKLFLASSTEVGESDENGLAEGARWEGYPNDASRVAYLTQQCFYNTLCTKKPMNTQSNMGYTLRTPDAQSTEVMNQISQTGYLGSTYPYSGSTGLRPAMNISGDTLVMDTVDSDGCYTVIFDDPPIITASEPSNLGELTKPFCQAYSIVDADGDVLTVTEKLNDTILRTLSGQTSGTKLTFDIDFQKENVIPDQQHTATIEVTDGILTTTHSWMFAYKNLVPIIDSLPEGNLGKVNIPIKQKYSVSDGNGNKLKITEKIDDEIIRTLNNQPSEATFTLDLTEKWSNLLNESTHTATVEVADGFSIVSRAWTFTKKNIEPIYRMAAPDASDLKPTSINVGELTNAVSEYKAIQVFVTNNALDENPIWEDATDSYLDKEEYIFKNTSKTNELWATAVKHILTGYPASFDVTVSHEMKM